MPGEQPRDLSQLWFFWFSWLLALRLLLYRYYAQAVAE